MTPNRVKQAYSLDSDVVTSLDPTAGIVPVADASAAIRVPGAVLWDMDGTLVDTEPYWLVAEQELVAAHGGTWTAEDGLTLIGAGLWHTASILQSRGVELSEAEIIDNLTERVLDQAKAAIPWRPGARELLVDLHDAGIPAALVTMSMRPLAQHIADSFDFPAFSVIVTGGDVTNAKPHPEPYLRAAELLQVDPQECVAIEDSLPGLASATASGAVTIGVAAHVPLEEDPSYTLWPSLAEKSIADLAEVFTQRSGEARNSLPPGKTPEEHDHE